MKKEFLDRLLCLDCRGRSWRLEAPVENALEIREATLVCVDCSRRYNVHAGVLDMLPVQLSEEIRHEKEHAETFDYVALDNGEKAPINRQTAERHRSLFLSLPAGDGSACFKPGGSFDNQAGNAGRYFKTLDLLKLKPGQRVLEVGASFGWSPWRFAQRGCAVTALDVTNYLEIADLYYGTDGHYFERVMADMSTLPFQDESYDLIFFPFRDPSLQRPKETIHGVSPRTEAGRPGRGLARMFFRHFRGQVRRRVAGSDRRRL